MSTNLESQTDLMCCAACGIAGVDEIKLKNCTACYLVQYCSVKCQKDHRPQHKRACKKKAAELRDELLFKQPESTHEGDCPICCLPLPIDPKKSTLMECCSKTICTGCDLANRKRDVRESLEWKCPFCRSPTPNLEDDETKKNLMRRIKANDRVAMYQMGGIRCNEGDHKTAFEYWTKAAALGKVGAHFQLSVMYREGFGVEKDKKKEVYHLEEAAIGGDPDARHNLGVMENENARYERAVKHFIIAAKLGCDHSLDALKEGFKGGIVTKDDLTAALRGHQAAIDAAKSPQRDEAEAVCKFIGERRN